MYINFRKIMERAKEKYKRDKNQARYMKEGIELAKRYVLDYIQENGVQSEEELKNGILDALYEDSEQFAVISNIKNSVFEYEIMNLLIQHPDELERIYSRVEGNEKSSGNTNYVDKSFEERKEDLVRLLTRTIEQFKADNQNLLELVQKYKAGDKIAKEIVNGKRSKMHPKQRKIFDEQFACFQEGNLKMIKAFLPDYRQAKGEELKETYIKTLGFIGEFFKRNGLLEKYIQMNDRQLRDIGLSELCIKNSEAHSNTILSVESLEKLELDALPVMTSFWINRYTKEIKRFNNGIFAINALGLWQDLLDGKTEFDISDEQLKAIFCKTEFADTVNKIIDKVVKEKINSNSATITRKENDVVAVDAQEEIDQIEEMVRMEYHDEFEGILPNSYKQIFDDLEIFLPLFSNSMNAYSHKDEILATQMLSYMRSKRIKNWGYIKEENDNMVILGIDYEGYNMPVRVHIHKKNIISILEEAGLTLQIPMYEGNDDMIINGELLKTYVITNLSEGQEKLIKRLLEENKKPKPIMRLLEHLNFLRDKNKYPKHLMQPITKKGQIVFARTPRKYINIETNQIFVTDENGRLVKEESEGR